ncbi:2-oxoglutarate/malate transporter [Streptomyces bluensis]|uniref:2-oxoglutarate/malate transporter n=1 Tax=Streptomyces bluensis TaxID=33897 RepID=UPI003323A4D5
MPSPAPFTGFSRISGLSALGFALLIVLANVLMVPAGLPRTGADLGEVNAFFGTEGHIVGLGSALTPAAWVLATVFGAGAVSVLWRSDRGRGEAWSLVGFAGLVLQNAAFAGVVATRLALVSTAPHDTTATAGLWALHDALFTLNGTFLATALTGLSAGGLRAGLIRSWHGALGLLAAALMFGSAILTPVVIAEEGPLGLLGLVGWLAWVVWIVTYGITLIRLDPSGSAAPGTAAPGTAAHGTAAHGS